MRAWLHAAWLLGLAGPGLAQQGALELFVGETLFVGGTRAALTWLHQEGGALALDGTPASNAGGLDRDRDVVVLSWATNLRRGLDVALVLPWLSTDARFLSAGAPASAEASGIGDLALVFKQRVYNDTWNRGAWNIAVLFGTETPTGETGERSGSGLVPPTLQPGSGSWDPFLSVASTFEQGRFRADTQIFWQTFGQGDQDHEGGDLLSVEFDVGYRVVMTQYPGPTLGAKIGARWRHRERAELAGAVVASSGGDELSLILASSWHPRPEWDVSFRFEVPTLQELNGTQIETDYRALVGVGLRF